VQVERAEGRWGGTVERRFRNPAVGAPQTPWGELCLSAFGGRGGKPISQSRPGPTMPTANRGAFHPHHALANNPLLRLVVCTSEKWTREVSRQTAVP
jgi:hypothetical protein